MTGLEQLRSSLDRPELTEADADWLLKEISPWSPTPKRRFSPQERSLSCQEIAELEGCTRGPVVRRCRVWLQRAKALLAERDGD